MASLPIGGSEERESKTEMQGIEALVLVTGSYQSVLEGSERPLLLHFDRWSVESVSCAGDGGGDS